MQAQLPYVVGSADLLGDEVNNGHKAYDYFGYALAVADFNSDGVEDLAAGLPTADCSATLPDCGKVEVRWGSLVQGLGTAATTLGQVVGGPDGPAENEQFGHTLASGDFNGDGRADLAVGIPFNTLNAAATRAEGAVQIHYGTANDISPGIEFIRQGTGGVPGFGISGDKFGIALAVGDFNGDHRDDLAIGAPGDIGNQGTVTIVEGQPGGLLPAGGTFSGFSMKEGDQGLPDTPEADDLFGSALSAGDYNGDGYDDLAIGIPGEDGVGAVLIVFGSPNSLIFANHVFVGQGDLGEVSESGDYFGAALATGDFNHDGYDDLAMGAPYESAGAPGPLNIGIFGLLFGAPPPDHFNFGATRWYWEDRFGIDGVESEESDLFGSSFAVGDFDGDRTDDLAVGAWLEDDLAENGGAVTVLLGKSGSIEPRYFRRLSPGQGLASKPQQLAVFSLALAAGDFDRNGLDDLAVGAPFWSRDDGTAPLVGAVSVVSYHFADFADGFESGDLSAWSSSN